MDKDSIQIPEIKLDEVEALDKPAVTETVTYPQIAPTNELVEKPVSVMPNEAGDIEIKRFNFKKIKFPKFNFRKGNTSTSGTGRGHKKAIKIGIGILVGVLILIVVLGIAIGIPGIAVYNKAKVLQADVTNIKAAASRQNISEVKTATTKIQTDLKSFESSYNLLAWTRFIPVLGSYWSDGSHAVKGGQYALNAAQIGIDTATPYADIIGFTGDTGKKAANAEENANDRIEFIVSSIKDVLPKIDELSKQTDLAKKEFDQIDANRYPVSFSGKPVRANIKKALDLVDEGSKFVSQSKPLLQVAPYLMGIDAPRTYLVIFQNDKELRPTGGFITGYSIMNIDKGKVSSVTSNDIYNLDKNYTPVIKAPDPIIKLIKGPYALSTGLWLRDMNFNPDFKVSMQTFVTEAQKAGIPKIDGVIAVDTQVLVNVLNVIGTIGVPGYGNFGTQITPKCNCPDVVYQLEDFADTEGAIVYDQNDPTKVIFATNPNYLNRKAIVGPLMNSILKNAMGQPKEKLPQLFQAGWDSLTQKHVLFYMLDAKAQAGVESFDIAGRVQENPSGTDYLFVNDANLGGRKSNLYVTNEITQEANIGFDGSVTRSVTLTYKNSQGYDGWLNSVLPSWVRIYVPKGSTLISVDGLDDKQAPYEDLGKTVFAGSYSLRPLGVQTITVKYKLPFKVKSEYNLYLQKQAGVGSILETIKVGRQTQSVNLMTDQELRFKL